MTKNDRHADAPETSANATTASPEQLQHVAERLMQWAQTRRFEGIDPYDALNSPLAPLISLGTRYGRIALTQLLRRSPINLRPILLIKPGANPKAFALFLEGCVALRDVTNARFLARRLLDLRSDAVKHSAWGYNFPWQNRFQLLPANTPTIVNTSFAAHALLDLVDLLSDHDSDSNSPEDATLCEDALGAALDSAKFILNDLNRLDDGEDAFCFSYTPEDRNFVHNANMLGASLLARLAVRHGAAELLAHARAALRYSMRRQHDDGSWFYAERREQNWIDSFHTGFNLEALRRCLALGVAEEYRARYSLGVNFYAERFFLDDGTPKYYADRVYTVDVHAPAEAICFFAKEPGYADLTRRVTGWLLDNLYDEKRGTFWFRKSARITIKTTYMRWTQAWAFRALAAAITAPHKH